MTDRLSWDTWLLDEGIDRTQSLIPSLESLRTPKRPFLDFFDAYLLPQYAQSTAAPYPPWQTIPLKIAEHLDNVQQQQQQQQLTQSQQQQPDAQRRRPRVVFSDEATVTSSNNHNTSTTTTAATASLHSIVSAAEAMTAKQKKTRLLLDSLLVELKTDFPSDEAVRDYFAVKTLIENLPGANPASATATSSDNASVSSGGGGGGSFLPSLIIPCDPSDPSHSSSSSSTFSATKGATTATPPTTNIKALCDSLLAAHKRAVEWVAAVKGGGGGSSDGGGGSGMGGSSSTSSSSASNRTAQLILRNHRASSSVERLGTTNAASATAAAMIDLLDFPSHHFGARHAVQLFFRKILDLSRQPRHQQLTIAQTNHVTRTRGKAAGSEAKEAARGDDQLLRIVFEKTLFPVAVQMSPPTKHFDALFTAAAGPIMDVSTLHLQVHGHIADKHLIVSVNHLKSHPKGGRSSAAGTRIGTSSTTTQAQQEGSPATLRHQPSSGQLSQISGGDDHPQQQHHNVDASDTRSVRSMSVTSTAPISGADHRRASSSLLGSVPLTPASLSAQAHPLGSTPHDYWISLKGIVFSIDLSKESIPAGRRLYYRVFLLPLFSGRECTRGLALLSAAANAHSDFLPYAQYCPKLHRAAESFLLAGDPLWRSTSLPQRMLLLHQKQSRSSNGEWEQLALHPSHWPDSVKQHVNRVLRLFLSDFHPIGKLKDVEDYWF